MTRKLINKQLELGKISREIERCEVCRVGKSGKAVPGEGNSDADIVFIGEAPGRKEAATGRPFIGRSGQLLRKLIKDIGLYEAGVYITSPVKYLPDYGTPSRADIEHGKVHLFKQLNIIEPKIVVLLGSVAQKAVLDKVFPVLKEHGRVVKQDRGKYFLTLHPAAALRFPKLKKLLIADFKKLFSLKND